MQDSGARVGVTYVWEQQNVWSQAAAAAKRGVVFARRALGGLTAVAAVLGAATAQVGSAHRHVAQGLAVGAAVALALVPLAAQGGSRRRIQAWTRLRSVSEALKAETYRYLAAVAPYNTADRDRELLDRHRQCTDDADDLTGHTAGLEPRDRPLPEIHDVDTYVRDRLEAQVEQYYRPQARRMARYGIRVRVGATALTVAGAVLSAAIAVLGDPAGVVVWIGVATTATTAVTGYGAAQQYEEQRLEYARTAEHLEWLRTVQSTPDAFGDAAFVAEVERIISLSNDGWMAKMVKEDGATYR
ncbi:DUF4231 domain-containing protein [Dactylosporangium sp. CA-092794]|uniref:DUF4231 domain-containing protein n=1 Tax=Dactylosporangium sp. CA-092794 TaxID=3239929 RepID=UPI003D8C8639